MKRMSKTWNRVVFNINRFNGTIKRQFDLKSLCHEVTKEEIDIVLDKIEIETNHFSFVRKYTKCKCFLLFSIFALVIVSLICLCATRDYKSGIITFIFSFLLSLFLIFLSTRVFKRFTRGILRTLYQNVYEANEKVFLKRRLYMVPNNEFRFIAVYIIPLTVNVAVLIHNFSIVNQTAIEAPSAQQMMQDNRKSIFSSKYTNFKNNYITAMNF